MIHEKVLRKLFEIKENKSIISIIRLGDKHGKYNIYEDGLGASFAPKLNETIVDINIQKEYFLASSGEKYLLSLLHEIHYI